MLKKICVAFFATVLVLSGILISDTFSNLGPSSDSFILCDTCDDFDDLYG